MSTSDRTVAESTADNSSGAPAIDPANQLIAMAMDKGMSVEVIEKLLDQKLRFEADEARKAFAAALVKCQKEMPGIVAAVELEKSGYYAKLGQINQLITPIYTKHGFSVSFGEGEAKRDDEIRTVGRLMHRAGHFADFYCDLPLDLTGAQGKINKTRIHAKGSSNSYGERYIIKRMFNLSILSEDDDGNLAGGSVDLISEDEALKIEAFISENQMFVKNLFREFRVESWGQIKSKDLDKTWARIKQIQGKR